MKNIFLVGDIGWEITYENLRSEIDISSSEDLRIFLYSPGGDVFEAFLMYDLLKLYKGKIEFVILGYTGSAASYLIFAGDTISGFKNSVWMQHRITVYAGGDADRLRVLADIAENMELPFIDILSEKLGMNKKSLLAELQKEIWIVGGDKLMEAGIISKIYDDIGEFNIDGDFKNEVEKEMEYDILEMHNIAQSQYRNVNKKLRDRELVTEQYEKVVALLNPKKSGLFSIFKNSQKNKLDNHIGSNEQGGDKEKPEMKLKDIMEKEHGIKLEVENMLKLRTDEITIQNKQAIEDAIDSEREIIAKILEYEGVNLSDIAIDCIENKKGLQAYMDAKLKAQAGKREDSRKTVFGKLQNKQTPGDQSNVEPEEDEKKFHEETEKMLNHAFPKRKKDGK